MKRRAASATATAVIFVVGAAAARGPETYVIPPGREALLGRMLGVGGPTFADGCQLVSARVLKSYVHARYACAGKRAAGLELHHPAEARAGAVRTARFAILPAGRDPAPPALLEAVAARVRELESTWDWTLAHEAPRALEERTTARAGQAPPRGPASALYWAAMRATREKRFEEALAALVVVVRRGAGVSAAIDRLVDLLDQIQPAPDALLAACEAAPGDALAALLGGVAAQIAAEKEGPEAGTPRARRALACLERARARFDHPALVGRAAVLHDLLGARAHALALADLARAGGSPDGHFQAARVYAASEVETALREVDRFFSMTARLGAEGQPLPPAKREAARALRERLHARLVTRASRPPLPLEPVGPEHRGEEPDPRQRALDRLGRRLSREGRFEEATAAYIALARRNPRYPAVMGRIVASLAPTLRGAESARPYVEAAARLPGDPLAQFVAGIAAHYASHNGARTREEKKALYSEAIRFLERARPAFDFEPRVHIYLAVSHFRLGRQRKAEELIQRGVELGGRDPDTFYFRAEIYHRVDVRKAIADIERYLAMTDELAKKGSVVIKPGNRERVRLIYEHLQRVAAGKAAPAQLFDPTPDALPSFETAPGSSPARPARRGAEPDPRETAFYEAGGELSRQERYEEALAIYLMLARRNPRYSAVMGRIVATVAPLLRGPPTARPFLAAADARPGDPLAHFVAGVAAHYAAHNGARSVDEKRALYREAIRYLVQARPALDFEPRLWIYLAVSHFRLGRQKDAERYIEEAVRRGPEDPDAFYCRAEIYQRVDVKRALRDIEVYLAMTERLLREGALIGRGKQERVRRMHAYLSAVARGDAEPVEMFDPIDSDQAIPEVPPAAARGLAPNRNTIAAIAFGVGVAGLAVWMVVTRIRRRRTGG